MTVRNMKGLAKRGHLATTLSAAALRSFRNFHEEINRRIADPLRMLEWGGDLFTYAAQHRFFTDLASMCNTDGNDPSPSEAVSIEVIQGWVRNAYRPKAMHLSSNPCSNLANAHIDQLVLDFLLGNNGWVYEWFREAQRLDPEYREWWEHEAKLGEAKRKAKEDAAVAAALAMHDARTRVRKTFAAGNLPPRVDMLLGWPTLDSTRSIRNKDLREWVEAAHASAAKDKENA